MHQTNYMYRSRAGGDLCKADMLLEVEAATDLPPHLHPELVYDEVCEVGSLG